MIKKLRISMLLILFSLFTLSVVFATDGIEVLPDEEVIEFTHIEEAIEDNASTGEEVKEEVKEELKENEQKISVEVVPYTEEVIEEDRTLVNADLSDKYALFLTLWDLIYQNKGEGGLFAWTLEGEGLCGTLTKNTRADFFANGLPQNTMGVIIEAPAPYAYSLFALLENKEAMEVLKPYCLKGEYVNLFAGLRLNGDVVIENPERYIATTALEKYLNNRGLEPELVYKAYEENKGMDKDEVIDEYVATANAKEIADEGAIMIYHQKEDKGLNTELLTYILSFTVGIILIVSVIFIMRAVRRTAQVKKQLKKEQKHEGKENKKD